MLRDPWVQALIALLTVLVVMLVGIAHTSTKDRNEYALVRCLLPTGFLYSGYTTRADLDTVHTTVHMVDAKTQERLSFHNSLCVISYDRELP